MPLKGWYKNNFSLKSVRISPVNSGFAASAGFGLFKMALMQ
jgi:hypothetical protein